MPGTPGIDVSRYQGEIDWKKVAAAGYKFAVIRATVGDYYTDPRFYTNWNGAKKNLLLVSAYHVVVPTRYADRQIERLFDVMDKRKADFPLVLDIERHDNLSAASVTACVRDCITLIRNRDKRRPIIYTARWFWNAHITPASDWKNYDLWVASYTKTPIYPTGWTKFRFWQYTASGKVPGVSGGTDCNWFNGDYDSLLAYAGTKPTKPTSEDYGLRAKVTATKLNVRSGPDTTSKVVKVIEKGTVVSLTGLAGKDLWVQFGVGKWAAAFHAGKKYLNIISSDDPADGIDAEVIAETMNIRSGPGITYTDIGDLKKGDKLDVLAPGGKDAWVQIEPGMWCAFSYGGETYMEMVK